MGKNTVSAQRFRNGGSCVVSVCFVLPESVNLALVLLALLSPHPFTYLEDVFRVLAFFVIPIIRIKRMLML